MTDEAKSTTAERVRRISFWIVIVLASVLVLMALLFAFPLLFINWLPTDTYLALRTELSPGDQGHRLHSLALGIIAWGMLVGLALQFHRPERKLAALLMALTVPVAVALGEVITDTYTVAGTAPFLLPILVACALHPSARAIIRLPHPDLPMLVLTVIAAGPWIVYALAVGETASAVGPEWELGHLSFIAAVAFLVLLWGLIGATDKPGWAFPAGAAVFATACVGLQSLLFSDVLSGLEPPWAWAAIAWSVAYGVAAWLRSRRLRSA